MMQRRGVAEVISALENNEATLVLLERDHPDERLNQIREMCEEQ